MKNDSFEIEVESLARALGRVVEREDDARAVAREAVSSLAESGHGQMSKYRDGHRFYTVAVVGRHPGDEPGSCLEIYTLVVVTSVESVFYDPSERVVAQVSTVEWRRPVTAETAPEALRERYRELREDGEVMDFAERERWARVLAEPMSRVVERYSVGGAA